MILYHFTAREYLLAILAEGLRKGEVPLAPSRGLCPDELLQAVWLTTDPNPDNGHGLTDGADLTEAEKATLGVPAHRLHERFFFPNKRAVRITVRIPSNDRALVHWPKWGRKRCAPGWYDALSRMGGGEARAKTWWLYQGVIPPDAFAAVEVRDGPGAPWRAAATRHPEAEAPAVGRGAAATLNGVDDLP